MGLRRDGTVGTPQLATPQLAPSKQEGLNLTLATTPDLAGFATDTYAITPQMRLRFAASERSIDGKTSPAKQPALPLFTPIPRHRHLRLLYLLQASSSNHNMALLAAATPFEMDALTQRVESNPDVHCITRPRSHCQWIPTGVALRPQKPGPQPNTWLPAR
jgi:hypothetical protein